MVIDLHNTRSDLVDTLANDAQALSHFLNTAKVAVVTVAVLANGNVEFDLTDVNKLKMVLGYWH